METALTAWAKKQKPEVIDIPDIVTFCKGFSLGLNQTFTFEGREYIHQILQDDSPRIAVMKSRQVGWTVLMAVIMAYNAIKYPGISLMYCTMDRIRADDMSKNRLKPLLRDQGITFDRTEDTIRSFRLPNKSIIRVISGYDGFSQARSYSVDMLFLDEVQNLSIDKLLNIERSMAQSSIVKDNLHGRMYMGGTGAMRGSQWDKHWSSTTQNKWQDGKWTSHNPDGTMPGYHITSRMMPNWTQEEEDYERANNPHAEFVMEYLGEIADTSDRPLPEHVVRQCMTQDHWDQPQTGRYIAGIDLANGGAADTVIVICEDIDGILHVRYAKAIGVSGHQKIYDELKPVLDSWNPDIISIDAGGHDALRELIRDNHTAYTYYMGSQNDPIKYDNPHRKISKTFFISKLIQRFHNSMITVPDAEPWVVEQLTSETMESKDPERGGSYIIYGKSAKDDLLMALTFVECAIYARIDNNNPNNFKGSFGIAR